MVLLAMTNVYGFVHMHVQQEEVNRRFDTLTFLYPARSALIKLRSSVETTLLLHTGRTDQAITRAAFYSGVRAQPTTSKQQHTYTQPEDLHDRPAPGDENAAATS
jgi:hypothetical protein